VLGRYVMTKPNLVVQAMTDRLCSLRRKHCPDMEGRWRNANRTAGHREEGRKPTAISIRSSRYPALLARGPAGWSE
jgi:hypothetical protein